MKILVSVLLLCLSVCVFADLLTEPKVKCTPEEFCIMPWNAWHEFDWNEGQYDDIMREMSECGFNVCGITLPQ